MKKYLLLFFLSVFVNSSLLAFENDLFKVNDTGWKYVKERDFLVFTLENSKEFVDPETYQTNTANIYVLVRVMDFLELTPDDYSDKNLEDFKNMFQGYLETNVNNQKIKILNEITKEHPLVTLFTKEYIKNDIDKRFERTKINSYSVKKIGKFQSYFIDFYNENYNVKYYSLHTMNHRYQIQLYSYKDVPEKDLKPAIDFINSFEPKDIAPTKINYYWYKYGLISIIVLILILGFVSYKLFQKQ